MLAEVQQLNRAVRFVYRSKRKAIHDTAKKIFRERFPDAKCDRGGCKNHVGRCSMDDYWEIAMAAAEEQFNTPEEIA